MLNESKSTATRAWPSWLTPLLSSVPTYLCRLVYVAVIVPCAMPLALILVLNTGSLTATTQTVLEMAAGSGTDPAAITLQTCDDDFTSSAQAKHVPHICTHYKNADVAVAELAQRAVPVERVLYLAVVILTLAVSWSTWQPTPFGWYLLERKAKVAEATEAKRHGAAQ